MYIYMIVWNIFDALNKHMVVYHTPLVVLTRVPIVSTRTQPVRNHVTTAFTDANWGKVCNLARILMWEILWWCYVTVFICFHSSGAVSSPPTGSHLPLLSSTPSPVDTPGKVLHNHLCITLPHFNQPPSLIPAVCVNTCLCIFRTKQLFNEYMAMVR